MIYSYIYVYGYVFTNFDCYKFKLLIFTTSFISLEDWDIIKSLIIEEPDSYEVIKGNLDKEMGSAMEGLM